MCALGMDISTLHVVWMIHLKIFVSSCECLFNLFHFIFMKELGSFLVDFFGALCLSSRMAPTIILLKI